MRRLIETFVAVSLLASSAIADARAPSPLPNGKPAGVKQAAVLGPSVFLLFLSAGIIVGGIAFAVSNQGNGGVTTPTTNSTTGLP